MHKHIHRSRSFNENGKKLWQNYTPNKSNKFPLTQEIRNCFCFADQSVVVFGYKAWNGPLQ